MTPDPPEIPSDRDAPPDDELLLDGQEEVFSRTEVERGLIEHHTLEEDEGQRPARDGRQGAPWPRAP